MPPTPDRELLDADGEAASRMAAQHPLTAIAYALISIAKDLRSMRGDLEEIRRKTARR